MSIDFQWKFCEKKFKIFFRRHFKREGNEADLIKINNIWLKLLLLYHPDIED
ncbi:hypothetical protein SAMN04489724_3503 [Algoriphagus locisalis]|uniref:Uncharacterized protein n=1 Tax=Algoriphagus locisalis TaxID=305507 RepID=A0A1I7CW37_9BACT|nr:hypothetical protein SAMN04489724_3503 [Algoriphagus locisalis]